ncbi:MAG: hypothetical protein OFPI_32260 [Osedax symbiont Rs2]|nr:MAG: hypothetical protein OFPI_32260 [Osedax symbiont Rs2]
MSRTKAGKKSNKVQGHRGGLALEGEIIKIGDWARPSRVDQTCI